jgi:hypothetical protein
MGTGSADLMEEILGKGQKAAASAKDRRAPAKTPRLLDPRGSRHDGGRSETRPRVKLKLNQ